MKKRPVTNDNKKSTDPKLPPKERIEKDADDLAHEKDEEEPTEIGEADPDDIVHRSYKPRAAGDEDSLEDPDDLVHGYTDDEEE
jgi:hypothetical protein